MFTRSVLIVRRKQNFGDKIAADGKGKIDYQILSDPGHQVIDAYGIRDQIITVKFEGIPRPRFVLDRSGP